MSSMTPDTQGTVTQDAQRQFQEFALYLADQQLSEDEKARAEKILRGMVREIREGDFPSWAAMSELQAQDQGMAGTDIRKELVREVVNYIKGEHVDDQRYMTDYDLARLDESDKAQGGAMETPAESAKRNLENANHHNVGDDDGHEDAQEHAAAQKSGLETRAEAAKRKARDKGDTGLANYIELRQTEQKEEKGLLPEGSMAALFDKMQAAGEPVRVPTGFEHKLINQLFQDAPSRHHGSAGGGGF